MRVLLIPSAILISPVMKEIFGELPTALLPLNNMVILDRIYQIYRSKVDKICVAGFERFDLLENYINVKKLDIELIKLQELGDLNQTIFDSIEILLKKYKNISQLLINFADLVFDPNLINKGNYIYYSNLDNINNPAEWTTFDFFNNTINTIYDKLSDKCGNSVFIGAFSIANIYLFYKFLKEASDKQPDEISRFYRALYNYIAAANVEFVKVDEWLDVGHQFNYNKAKTNVAARSFNEISIDEVRGILTKKSKNKSKLLNEIKWYIKMPSALQYLTPRIYDYSLAYETPYISMEYYGYQTLHESFLYSNLALVKWESIFKKLLYIVLDMSKFTVEAQDDYKEILKSIYVDKVVSRLNMIRDDARFASFFANSIIINGVTYRSLNEYIDLLPNLVNKYLINTFDGQFSIIHGDLCFANILHESKFNFMRLIDPRGSFGKFDIYGDFRYEIAKLLHSVEGCYDFIIEDLFDVSVSETSINYQLNKENRAIFKSFKHVFAKQLDGLWTTLHLIEATLFLSMIPLHSDFENRQYAMLATGVKFMESVLAEEE